MKIVDNDMKEIISEFSPDIDNAKLHFNEALVHLSEHSKYEEELAIAKKIIDKLIKRFEQYFDSSNILMAMFLRATIEDIAYIYGLAGEIYSHINEEKSLEYYKIFQYYTFWFWLTSTANQSSEEKFDYHDRKFYGVTAYKFRSCSRYLFDDLEKEQITLSRPSCMNDPFDSLYSIWSRPENLYDTCKDKKHMKMFHKSFDYYRFCSFCIDDDKNSILNNNLMWSHYANEHKGVCIRYKLMDDCISSSISLDIHHQTCLHRIHYSNSIDDKPISVNDKSIAIGAAFAQKQECWEYEKESRLICFDDTTENDRIIIPYDEGICIEAVYFGLNCSDKDEATIKKLLAGKQVEYYYMKLDNKNVYRMKIDNNKLIL